MGEGAWLGTTLALADAGSALSTLCAVALIVVRVAGGIALYAHCLPLRPHATLRVTALVGAGFVAFLVFLAASLNMGPIPDFASYLLQLAAFSLILAACVGGVLLLCDTSVWVALFCATAGYATQNLATGTSELAASLMRAAGMNPSAPVVYLANDAACLAVVFLACYLLLARRLDHEGLILGENRQMLLMMPVVCITIIGFDVLIKSLTGSGLALGYVVALRLFHGLACVSTLWIEYQMLYRVRIEQERAWAERLLAERERQYQLSRDNIDAINVKCHDIRHQIRTLATGGTSVDGAALADLAREVSIYDSLVKTGNEALDTIITEKSLLCEQQGITLTCIADGSALDFMAAADLYALFGNALDNAIEAVSLLEDPRQRSISLVVRQAMGCASIHMENFFAGERRFAEGLPLTTKSDRANHGFGTRSMRQIAERYGGTFSAEAVGETFKLDIMIPMA